MSTVTCAGRRDVATTFEVPRSYRWALRSVIVWPVARVIVAVPTPDVRSVEPLTMVPRLSWTDVSTPSTKNSREQRTCASACVSKRRVGPSQVSTISPEGSWGPDEAMLAEEVITIWVPRGRAVALAMGDAAGEGPLEGASGAPMFPSG